MIDRSYLPYQSAREFQDRGMAKWSGFFLSEHTTALGQTNISIEEVRKNSPKELQFLLSQAVQLQTFITITTLEQGTFQSYHGQVSELSANTVLLKQEKHYFNLPISTIISIDAGDIAYDPISE